jgi:basic membrane protein A and related proteins
MQRRAVLMLAFSAFLIVALAMVGTPTKSSVIHAATEQATGAAVAKKVRVALILIGPQNDGSWAEAAVNALGKLKDAGYDTAVKESVADTDVERVMRSYIDDGYNAIIAHSFSFQDAVFKVAQDNPDVAFIWAGGIHRTAKNVGDYSQPFYQGAYLAGIAAAKLSQSGSLGGLYGFDIPVCHAMGEALLAGAKTINQKATLVPGQVGDWGDVQKAKEAALAQHDTAGVDVWVTCGEGPALGAIEAAKQVKGFSIGYVGDMSKRAPDAVPLSIVWNMSPIFDAFVKDVESGKFDNGWYDFGVAEGAVDIAINPAFNDKIGKDTLDVIAKAKADITSKTLDIPFVGEAPTPEATAAATAAK